MAKDIYDDFYNSRKAPKFGSYRHESNEEEVLDALDSPKVQSKLRKLIAEVVSKMVKDALKR